MTKTYHIVHLEADLDVTERMAILFENENNISYEHASTEQEALDILNQNIPELLIVELRLSDYDYRQGVSFIKHAYKKYPGIRMMVLTNRGDNTLREELKPYIIDYELKIFKPSIIKKKIIQLLIQKDAHNKKSSSATNRNEKLLGDELFETKEIIQEKRYEKTQNKNEMIFICYSRKDEEFVLKMASILKNRGVPIWLDQFNIPVGADWDMCIDEALYECTKFMIVLSTSAFKSQEVRAEFRTALDVNKQIIPILIEECKIPRRLRLLQHVNLLDKSMKLDQVSDIIIKSLGL